jgi:glycosyltransferase involved in cell wall biosynthesis
VSAPIRVAYAVEQCWHDTPGGTAVAALAVADELLRRDDVDLRFVAGKHPVPPRPPYVPGGPVAMLPLARPWLYEAWTRLNWPKVESVTGAVDVVHATGLIPAATASPLVVTLHDVAFVHSPEKFTKHGARVMQRSLAVMRRRAAKIVCSSQATFDDLVDLGVDADRLRLVPLGVDANVVIDDDAVARVRQALDLPERFVLFVGTIEPRKNLRRLSEAMAAIQHTCDDALPLVVCGADGWGDVEVSTDADVRFVGFRTDDELHALYAAATVFAYPSEREGFGLPVLEAMARGCPVVTSRGTSTEEVAGGAAVLVDPFDVESIEAGIATALDDSETMIERGRRRAAEMTWGVAAERTLAVYREVAS